MPAPEQRAAAAHLRGERNCAQGGGAVIEERVEDEAPAASALPRPPSPLEMVVSEGEDKKRLQVLKLSLPHRSPPAVCVPLRPRRWPLTVLHAPQELAEQGAVVWSFDTPAADGGLAAAEKMAKLKKR